MNYLLRKQDGTITYPYSLSQLRTDNPTTSFPENLDAIAAEWNCFQVTSTEQPIYNPITHTLTENTPVLQGDVYYQSWQVAPYTLEQAKANKLAAIESEWDARLKQGYDSGRGTLGFTAEDVALLSGAFALAKEADAVGLAMPSLVTLENTLITFQNIQEMTALMLSYGASRSHISVQFASRRRAVQNATTIEEVEAA